MESWVPFLGITANGAILYNYSSHLISQCSQPWRHHRWLIHFRFPNTDQLSSHCAHFVFFALLLLVAHQFAKITWLVVPSRKWVPTPIVLVDTPLHFSKYPSETQYTDLASLHLFGHIVHDTPLNIVETPTAPTKLPLILRGILYSSDKQLAYAIIADDQGKENSFALDEALYSQASLEAIYVDHVVIRNGSTREELRFPTDTADSVSMVRGIESVEEVPLELGPTKLTPIRESRGPEGLKELRELVAANPREIIALTESPAATDISGQILGYRLENENSVAVLRRLGLRSGDILTAINDVPLTNGRQIAELSTQLPTTKEVQIHYLRRGTPRVMVFSALN